MFEEGNNFGNRKGRPKGSRNKTSALGDIIRSEPGNLKRKLSQLRKHQQSEDENIALKALELELKYGWSFAPNIHGEDPNNPFQSTLCILPAKDIGEKGGIE